MILTMDETVNMAPTPIMRPKQNKGPLVAFIVVVILAASVGGYFYFNQPKKTEETKEAVVATVTPTPTDKPEIDKTSVKVQVINGTGTPGQAGQVVEALEDAGYSADNIETGNADEFDNTVTTITAREDFKDVADDIKDLLSPTFDNVRVESSELETDSEFDIVIVTGGKIFETPTPSSEPTNTPTPTGETTLTPSPTFTPTPTLTPVPTSQ